MVSSTRRKGSFFRIAMDGMWEYNDDGLLLLLLLLFAELVVVVVEPVVVDVVVEGWCVATCRQSNVTLFRY